MRLTTPEEKLQYAKARDAYHAAQKRGCPAFTDFLNPVLAEAFLSEFDNAAAFGGYADAERRVLGFAPEGVTIAEADFPVAPLTITFDERYAQPPTHRDYLGAALGLGIDRAKVGDIRLAAGGALLYAKGEIADYIAANLRQAGRVNVRVTPGAALAGLTDSPETMRVTVASLRLDAVISAAFRLSRGKAAALVESEKALVNWRAVTKPGKVLAMGDVVTVRGLGRVRVEAEAGRTKKDRVVLEIRRG